MKKETTTILFAVLVAAGASVVNAGNPKVNICHIPPDDPENYHTITVGETAITAHLAHNDILGLCNQQCDTICSDNNKCTIDHNNNCEQEGCASFPRNSINCDDSNPCTVDSCDPASGCINTPIVCNDGNLCTVDTCNGGQCEYTPTVCPEGQSCDQNSGICVSSPDPECEPASCYNFIPCNEGGSCNNDGVCTAVAEGGGLCVAGSTPCSSVPDCNTSADCGPGVPCVLNTCCGVGKCAPQNIWCSNVTNAARATSSSDTSSYGEPTFGRE